MKYDIAKNEGGPLRKTMKTQADKLQTSDTKKPNERLSAQDNGDVTAERYPALDERLRNIETHVAIRYGERRHWFIGLVLFASPIAVPSPPRSLLDRLKFLEDHLVQLEKEYPPWAALHFNQPNRGVCTTIYVARLDKRTDIIQNSGHLPLGLHPSLFPRILPRQQHPTVFPCCITLPCYQMFNSKARPHRTIPPLTAATQAPQPQSKNRNKSPGVQSPVYIVRYWRD